MNPVGRRGGEGVEIVAEGVGFTEGPVALPGGGIAFVSDSLGCVFAVGSGGRWLRRFETGGGPNGLTCDATGVLYVAQNGGVWFGKEGRSGVQRIGTGGDIEYIATGGFNAPNDICFGPDGRLYFTDPGWSASPYDPDAVEPGRLFSCRTDGSDLQLLHEGLRFINGLAFDASGTVLYMAEMARGRIVQANVEGGVVNEPSLFFAREGGAPDGFALDREGNLWLPSQRDDAVFVVHPTEGVIEVHQLPAGSWPTNCCFGGSDMRSLYVTMSKRHAVGRLHVRSEGLVLYPLR